MAKKTNSTSQLTEFQRLKLSHYTRRIDSHGVLRKYFINKIFKHCADFPLTRRELNQLGYEDLGELAVAAYSKQVVITLGSGKDFAHGSDKKCVISQHRNNSIKRGSWLHTYAVTGLKHKQGNILVTAYNSIAGKIDHFFIPKEQAAGLSRAEICIEQYSSIWEEPEWTGKPQNTDRKFWEYHCTSFEEMIDKDLASLKKL